MGWLDPHEASQDPEHALRSYKFKFGRCILCGRTEQGMWAHFNSESHQTMVLLNMQAELALPPELRAP